MLLVNIFSIFIQKRLAVTVKTGTAPADRASNASSSRLASKSPFPKSTPTRTAFVISTTCSKSHQEFSSSIFRLIALDGTTVEIACL